MFMGWLITAIIFKSFSYDIGFAGLWRMQWFWMSGEGREQPGQEIDMITRIDRDEEVQAFWGLIIRLV